MIIYGSQDARNGLRHSSTIWLTSGVFFPSTNWSGRPTSVSNRLVKSRATVLIICSDGHFSPSRGFLAVRAPLIASIVVRTNLCRVGIVKPSSNCGTKARVTCVLVPPRSMTRGLLFPCATVAGTTFWKRTKDIWYIHYVLPAKYMRLNMYLFKFVPKGFEVGSKGMLFNYQ